MPLQSGNFEVSDSSSGNTYQHANIHHGLRVEDRSVLTHQNQFAIYNYVNQTYFVSDACIIPSPVVLARHIYQWLFPAPKSTVCPCTLPPLAEGSPVSLAQPSGPMFIGDEFVEADGAAVIKQEEDSQITFDTPIDSFPDSDKEKTATCQDNQSVFPLCSGEATLQSTEGFENRLKVPPSEITLKNHRSNQPISAIVKDIDKCESKETSIAVTNATGRAFRQDGTVSLPVLGTPKKADINQPKVPSYERPRVPPHKQTSWGVQLGPGVMLTRCYSEPNNSTAPPRRYGPAILRNMSHSGVDSKRPSSHSLHANQRDLRTKHPINIPKRRERAISMDIYLESLRQVVEGFMSNT